MTIIFVIKIDINNTETNANNGAQTEFTEQHSSEFRISRKPSTSNCNLSNCSLISPMKNEIAGD